MSSTPLASLSPSASYSASPQDVFFKFNVKTTLSQTAAKVVDMCPQLLIGSHRLFQWNSEIRQITLSDPFQNLLELLYELETFNLMDDCRTLDDLNAILQLPQGGGGLLRKHVLGQSRSDIVDLPSWVENRMQLEELLGQLGFSEPSELPEPVSVDHCLIFGMKADRMIVRIKETVELMEKGLLLPDQIFLLGSQRQLKLFEKKLINQELKKLPDSDRKNYWQEFFANEEEFTEGNAFAFLWECYVPAELKKPATSIHSTALGCSYGETQAYRTTTEVTTDDWATSHYDDENPQVICSVIEQPFGRLQDQLLTSVLTNAKRASCEMLVARIQNTTFHSVLKEPKDTNCLGIRFDEIARNVYRTVDLLKNYLNKFG